MLASVGRVGMSRFMDFNRSNVPARVNPRRSILIPIAAVSFVFGVLSSEASFFCRNVNSVCAAGAEDFR